MLKLPIITLKTPLLISSVFLLFLASTSIFAQRLTPKQIVNNQPSYKAELVYDHQRSSSYALVEKIARKASNYYLEVSFLTNQASESNSLNTKGYIVVYPDESALFIDHNKKTYVKFDLSYAEIFRLEFIDTGITGVRILAIDRLIKNTSTTLKIIGSENIDGYNCWKIKAMIDSEESFFQSPLLLYAAKDLKNLIIKVQEEETNAILYKLKNISLTMIGVPNKLFKVPKNYKLIEEENNSDLDSFYDLDSFAKNAFEANRLEEAKTLANELLSKAEKYKDDPNYSNAIHQGNLILGRIALKHNNIEKAKGYLLKAGQAGSLSCSPTLSSFGPNMALAKELLEKGHKEIVLQYFDLCEKFWSSGKETLIEWRQIVSNGDIPDFGANLDY